MKWSWKIGTLAGIDLRVHATLFLLLVWAGASHALARGGAAAALEGMVFLLTLFGCVLLHELGHALAARRYGIPTHDITLLPIGGVARLARMPERPGQEMVVALAGPAVNVALAAALWLWQSVAPAPMVAQLLTANVGLVLFNLIPAFPMDGGRVLRAALAARLDYGRATRIAATVGQGLALLFGLVGLFTYPMLLFVALFVWIGASQEADATQMRSALAGTPVQAAMLTDFRVLDRNDSLQQAVWLTLNGYQQDFPVLDGSGRPSGVLTRDDLMAALTEHGAEHPVEPVMRREFVVVEAGEMLPAVLERLQESESHTVMVMRGERLAGLLTMDNLGEFLLIDGALRTRARGQAGASVSRPIWDRR